MTVMTASAREADGPTQLIPSLESHIFESQSQCLASDMHCTPPGCIHSITRLAKQYTHGLRQDAHKVIGMTVQTGTGVDVQGL